MLSAFFGSEQSEGAEGDEVDGNWELRVGDCCYSSES